MREKRTASQTAGEAFSLRAKLQLLCKKSVRLAAARRRARRTSAQMRGHVALAASTTKAL
jgi:hypothetical protein